MKLFSPIFASETGESADDILPILRATGTFSPEQASPCNFLPADMCELFFFRRGVTSLFFTTLVRRKAVSPPFLCVAIQFLRLFHGGYLRHVSCRDQLSLFVFFFFLCQRLAPFCDAGRSAGSFFPFFRALGSFPFCRLDISRQEFPPPPLIVQVPF